MLRNLKKYIKKKIENPNRLYILNYHQITDNFCSLYNNKGTWTSFDFFKNQISFLKTRYNILKLSDAISLIESKSLKGVNICLTFDDGDISIQNKLYDFLLENKIPSTFFINSCVFDNKINWVNAFDYILNFNKDLIPDELLKIREQVRTTNDKCLYNSFCDKIDRILIEIDLKNSFYVSKDFLKKLDQNYFEVGLHGYEHHRHSMMGDKWQKENIIKNLDTLKQFENFVPFFAIPFGRKIDWNDFTIELCEELNLRIFSAQGGYNTRKTVIYNRIPADNRDLKDLIENVDYKFFERIKELL